MVECKEKTRKYESSIMGFIVGDALGVPAEFMRREMLKAKPIVDMIGYGTYNQPAGTWSDDSSMVIATMEWIGESKELSPDYHSLMNKFLSWLKDKQYTPYGKVFDRGIATLYAIRNYDSGVEPLLCGGTSEGDNGNGSLMRILPVALAYSDKFASSNYELAETIMNLSALTHAHARSKVGCLIYSKIIATMMDTVDTDKVAVLEKGISYIKEYFDQSQDEDIRKATQHYNRIWNVKEFKDLSEDDIRSTGYVVHTLEAALWCFLNTNCYEECVLKAVNLGEDTDTVAAIAGGLAGLYYGYESIPTHWIELIPRRDWIMELIRGMA